MDYSPAMFDALVDEIETQGGAMLPETCVSFDIRYDAPPYARASTQKRATCGCNNESRAVVVYDPPKGSQPGAGFAAGCAVCDSMGAWPRFREVVNAIRDAEDAEDEDA